MKRTLCFTVLCMMLCVLCSGCSVWTSGEYLSVTPHQVQSEVYANRVIEVTSYTQLRNAISNLVRNGAEDGVISISAFNKGTIHFYVDTAITNVIENTAYGAYAVEKITYEIGTNRGDSVVACKIHYRNGYQQPMQIKRIGNVQELSDMITDALQVLDRSVLVYTEQYEKIDVQKIISEFASSYPDKVIEIPSVEFSVYPEKGAERIIEISFEYKTDRILLQQMRGKAEEFFRAAEQSVQGINNVEDIYNQIYLYLKDHCKYTDIYSDTPVLDLLTKGQGNEKIIADIYARICTRLGLGCKTVSGTLNGRQWFWNAVQIRGKYYDVDLIRCLENQAFQLLTDEQLNEYNGN